MSHFSEFQVAQYGCIYDMFCDSDGTVGIAELQALLVRLFADPHLSAGACVLTRSLCSFQRQFGPDLDLEEVQALLNEFDSQKKRKLCFTEFIRLLGKYEVLLEEKKKELEQALEYFDNVRFKLFLINPFAETK